MTSVWVVAALHQWNKINESCPIYNHNNDNYSILLQIYNDKRIYKTKNENFISQGWKDLDMTWSIYKHAKVLYYKLIFVT